MAEGLRDLLSNERQALIEAISADFSHRSADETLLAELMPSLHGIHYASRHLKGWMKASRRKVGVAFQPASAKVVYQPLGVVGVIVPWNYPLYLAIGPLVGALAAGNRVMLKLSESTPATGLLLKELLARMFPEDLVCVVLGEADIGVAFSRLPFDHLLFTGSTSIGKHVMRAAAENLTPVTLELGGKSPAIVSRDVPLKDAAERIAFGKTLNAGQTCVAPITCWCRKTASAAFVEAYRQAVQSFYPTPRRQSGLHGDHQRTPIGAPQRLRQRRDQQRRAVDSAVRARPGPTHAAQCAVECQRRDDRDAGRNLRPVAADRAVSAICSRHLLTSISGHVLWLFTTSATTNVNRIACCTKPILAACA